MEGLSIFELLLELTRLQPHHPGALADTSLDELYRQARERLAAGEVDAFQALAGCHPEHEAALLDLATVHDALALPSPGSSPKTLLGGRYVVLDVLGRGGQAVVYRALDPLLWRQVAIKILPPDVLPSREAMPRLLQEARALAALDHPHLVRVHEAELSASDGSLAIVLELVRGQDLGRWLASSGPLPVAWVAEIGWQIATALQHLHEAGLVHRDVKAANILVQAEGLDAQPTAKLADLGLARRDTHAGGTPSAAGAWLGSLETLAPEQMLEAGTAGPPADVFSLGCVLFECVTGGRLLESVATPARYEVLTRLPETLEARLAGPLRGLLPVLGPMLQRESHARPTALLAAQGIEPHSMRARDAVSWSTSSDAHLALAAHDATPPPNKSGTNDFPIDFASLAQEDRLALEGLALFEGSFRVDSAERFLGRVGAQDRPRDAIGRLLEVRALRRTPGSAPGLRLEVPALLREAARQSARRNGSLERLRLQHFEYCANLARSACQGLAGPEQRLWALRICDDLEDLLAAVKFGTTAGRVDEAASIAVNLSRYFLLRSTPRVGRALILGALRRRRRRLPGDELAGRAWLAIGSLAIAERRWAAGQEASRKGLLAISSLAIPHLESALGHNWTIAAEHRKCAGPPRHSVPTTFHADPGRDEGLLLPHEFLARGRECCKQGTFAVADEAFSQAHALFEARGDAEMVAWSEIHLAEVAQSRGQLELARLRLENLLHPARAEGLVRCAAYALNNLGTVHLDGVDFGEARRAFDAALAKLTPLGDGRASASVWNNLGSLALAQGRLEEAQAFLARSGEHMAAIGEPQSTILLLNNARLSMANGSLAGASLAIEQAICAQGRSRDRLSLVGIVECIGELHHALGNPVAACEHLGAATAAREEIGAPRPGPAASRLKGLLDRVKKELGAAAAEAAVARGRSRSLEELEGRYTR